MKRCRLITGLATILALSFFPTISSEAHSEEDKAASMLLPAEVDNPWIASRIEALDAVPLWHEKSGREFHSRYRLTMSGVNCTEFSFRIDVTSRGIIRGRSASRDKCSDNGKSTVTDFQVRRIEVKRLEKALKKAELWTHFPEFWGAKNGEICLDGNELIFEKFDSKGYGYSHANWPCNFTFELIEAAKLYIEIFNADDARLLLK